MTISKPVYAVGVVRRQESGRWLYLARMRTLTANQRDTEPYLEFPGGKVEPDQTVEQALVAEVVQETGLLVVRYRAIDVFERPGGSGFSGINFLFHVEVEPGKPETEPGKQPWRWVSRGELIRGPTSELSLAAIHAGPTRYERVDMSGRVWRDALFCPTCNGPAKVVANSLTCTDGCRWPAQG